MCNFCSSIISSFGPEVEIIGKVFSCRDMAVMTRSSLDTGVNIALAPRTINKKETLNKHTVNQNWVCWTELI